MAVCGGRACWEPCNIQSERLLLQAHCSMPGSQTLATNDKAAQQQAATRCSGEQNCGQSQVQVKSVPREPAPVACRTLQMLARCPGCMLNRICRQVHQKTWQPLAEVVQSS